MSVLPAFGLRRPETLDDALAVLSFDDLPLAGGTELLLAMRMRVLRPDTLVDVKRLPELRGVRLDGDHVVVGGGVTHLEASSSELVRKHLPILADVLDLVGNPRIRASGTLAGNLVFAEPKSDVTTILMALDAEIVLRSPNGGRTLDVDQFILGPYFSAREPDELVTEIRIPTNTVEAAAYAKFQTMERPTVAVAALDIDSGQANTRRIVVGAVADRPRKFDFDDPDSVDADAMADGLDPIGDLAGDVRYKRHVTAVYIRRAIARLEGEGR